MAMLTHHHRPDFPDFKTSRIKPVQMAILFKVSSMNSTCFFVFIIPKKIFVLFCLVPFSGNHLIGASTSSLGRIQVISNEFIQLGRSNDTNQSNDDESILTEMSAIIIESESQRTHGRLNCCEYLTNICTL